MEEVDNMEVTWNISPFSTSQISFCLGGYQPQAAAPGYPGYQAEGGYQASPYPGNYPAPPEQAYPAASPGSPSHGGGLLSNCRGTKKALLIGINYFGQRGELRGCINDVKNVKNLIMSRGKKLNLFLA